MKIDLRIAILSIIIGFVLSFIFKTSGVSLLESLDVFSVIFIALASLQTGFAVSALFIVFSTVLDLMLFQPVGFTIAAIFSAYLFVGLVNKIFSITKKPDLGFNLIVLTFSVFINNILLVLLNGQEVSVNPLHFIVLIIVFVIIHSLIKRITLIRNAY